MLIDETYAFNPTSYDYQTFLNTFGLTGQEPYPFLQTRRVYRQAGSRALHAAWPWAKRR